MYAVPHKPFSQTSIEDNNSVFGRKFWNHFEFRNTIEIKKYNYSTKHRWSSININHLLIPSEIKRDLYLKYFI
jgi:hypothetical protein